MRISELIDYRLVFRDADEMKAIAEYLSSHDFEVYNYDEIMLSSEIGKWKCFKWNEEEENFNRTNKVIDDCLNIEELPRINYVSKRNRILKPDIDPFGEENWGYTKESVSLGKINVGDKVILSEIGKNKKILKDLRDCIGVVEKINKDNKWPLKIKWEYQSGTPWWNIAGYGGYEIGVHKEDELDIVESVVKKISNLKEDPFGEENWWEMNESVSLDELTVGDRVVISDEKKEQYPGSHIYCKKFLGLIGIVESIHRGSQYQIYVNWGKETGCHFKEELNIAKPVKRILNLEDDPFGEEDWGYVKEQVKYEEGQEVELVGIVDGKRLDGLSGKIRGIDLNGVCYTNMNADGRCAKYGYSGKMYYIGYRISWWIPPYNIKNYKIVNRILKPDIDPFGEENWVTENNNKEMITDFKIFEKQYNPYIGEYFQVKYWLTGDLVPVKVIKVNPNNTYLVSFDVDGSVAKGAPEMIIKNSDIVAPYKTLRSPVGTGFISTNTNMSIRQVHQVSNDMYL